jgi:hypothetical protein
MSYAGTPAAAPHDQHQNQATRDSITNVARSRIDVGCRRLVWSARWIRRALGFLHVADHLSKHDRAVRVKSAVPRRSAIGCVLHFASQTPSAWIWEIFIQRPRHDRVVDAAAGVEKSTRMEPAQPLDGGRTFSVSSRILRQLEQRVDVRSLATASRGPRERKTLEEATSDIEGSWTPRVSARDVMVPSVSRVAMLPPRCRC